MDKNNRVLVAVILLIFVTLLSFNIDTISGSSTKSLDKPSVKVITPVVEEGAGARITVEVVTGKFGVNEQAVLYDRNSRVYTTNSVCDQFLQNRHYKCIGDEKSPIKFNFRLSTSLPSGLYNVCVWDYEVAKNKENEGDNSRERGNVCGSFTIRPKIQPEKEQLGESS